ncbi:MAG: membrane protein insertion efficiency factor YidD [Candidatus Aegiribacteria sp.]|nr:membrane protein insertion efficiency factor YidD [Candidatus Aegiribacteria sp.]
MLFIQYRGLFRDLLARRCVYYPSCSHYGQDAVQSQGPVLGLMIALERWTRCTSAALRYGDYRTAEGNRLADPLNPGEEVICWGRFLLPF